VDHDKVKVQVVLEMKTELDTTQTEVKAKV
jgi:hypothetical protein